MDDSIKPQAAAPAAARRQTIAVIINGGAGAGHDDQAASDLREKFAAAGCEAAITLARSGEQMISTAKQALRDKVDAIVAGGGDGTINAVASVVAGSNMPFGVLPLGTLNHFAKDIGVPLTLDDAVQNVATGMVIAVDVGEVNGRIFLNNSGLGLYPDIVHDREKQQSRLGRGKWLAAMWASVAALRRYPFLQLTLCIKGENHQRSTPFVFIGNNEYSMAGLSIGERATLQDGLLSVYVAQRPGRLGLLRFGWRALFGKLAAERDFDAMLCDRFDITTHHKRLRVATDGEVTVMQTPLKYKIRPADLRVIVPVAK
ncbi:MAG TPA: diacylglycerol kinase family protein [Telluria sp.]|nr:diacylglycerol kinase family protein [Telluria sp.]